MAHGHVDGTLVIAKLKRDVLGGGLYTDVTVRRDDGSHEAIGSVIATTDLRFAMVPGSRGRFYYHEVLGAKAIHGFRPLSGKAQAYFPYRWDLMTSGLGAINLLVALGWWLLQGSFAPVATIFGMIGIVMGALFLATRTAAMRHFRADDPVAPSAAELSAAGVRA
jgi:hypothetical protein